MSDTRNTTSPADRYAENHAMALFEIAEIRRMIEEMDAPRDDMNWADAETAGAILLELSKFRRNIQQAFFSA